MSFDDKHEIINSITVLAVRFKKRPIDVLGALIENDIIVDEQADELIKYVSLAQYFGN